MTVDPKTLEQYEGKQVLLTLAAENGDAKELEGKVEAASVQGMAFKEKGKRDVELVMPNEIVEIALAPVKPKPLIQKKLKLVSETTVRQHLLDRHGYERTVVNAMSEDSALMEHEDIDHKDLGHKHEAEDDNGDEADNEADTSTNVPDEY